MPAAVASIASLLVLFTAGVAAQPLASLSGRISDTSQGGIGLASISIVNEDTGFRRALESQPDGAYSAGSLEPGMYKVTVRKDGFRGMQRFDIPLTAGSGTRADFVLPVGSMFETVTVRGTAPLVNDRDASTGTLFRGGEIPGLPLNGGGLLNLIEMTPGANIVPATRGEAGQFTVTGQRANTNYFTIDGVSANTGISGGGLPAQSTGGTLPSVSAFGSLDAAITLSAVDDLRIQSSTAVAQFGRMPGANLGVSSQAGSNEFHGATVYQVRNQIFGANDWFANRAGLGIAPAKLNQVTQTLGGPVHRNSTFFFLSYQQTALLEPFTGTQAVPSDSLRQSAALWAQPALSLFPAANQAKLSADLGQWTGSTDQPASLHSGSARVDQAVGSRINFFGRYSDAPSTNRFGIVTTNQLDLRTQSLTLGLSAHLGGSLTLDTRINESLTQADSVWTGGSANAATTCALEDVAINYIHTAASCSTLVRISIDGVGELTAGREGSRRQRQFQAVQSGSFRLGAHEFGFGADFRRITAVRRDAAGTIGAVAGEVTDFVNTGNLWSSNTPALSDSASANELSLWVQDTWRPLARLTVAWGLRWEFSPPVTPAEPVNFRDGSTGVVAPQQRDLWPVSYHDFAPRLGLAYRLTKDGRTVIRAGGGIYYESSFSIATDILNGGPLNATGLTSGVHAPFSTVLKYGFDSGLRIPQVRQWNIAVERAISERDTISAGYVGADGRALIRREAGGKGSVPTEWFALTTNGGASDYQALQVQYRRTFARNFQASAAYTWSHSIDNDSSDAFLLWAGATTSAAGDRGSSDFDLRHSFTASASYLFSKGSFKGWRASVIARARSGFPISVLQSQQYTGIAFMNAFRPDQLLGVPVWIDDPSSPGGRHLNPAAFLTKASGVQGSLGRNAIDGLGTWQLDAAVGREFVWRDRYGLDLRVEAFNALNHASFGDPVRYLDSPLFGQSTSMLNLMLGTGSPGSGLAPIFQSGAPRMLQGTIRFRF